MGTKVIEIVNINDKDDDNYNNNNHGNDDVTLLYESITISHIEGTTLDNPIVIEDDGECSNSNDDVIIIKKESSSIYPPVFICEICTDSKHIHDIFRVKGCDHRYCSDCIAKYIACKIQDNITNVTCPDSDCNAIIEPESCRGILPRQVFDRWGDALCEALVSISERFYCPYKDCSAMLLIDDHGNQGLKQCECPYCWRLFCAQCKVAWHGDIDCDEFQKLNKDERERDDIKLMNLAKNKNWMRCPSCKFYVERIEGCLFIKCRCGYTFCYNCGAHLTNHYCTKCKH